jgi:hypothetical protein
MLTAIAPPVLAPDQIYGAGFRDGFNRRIPNPNFSDNIDYLRGHVAGYRTNPQTLFNVETSPEALLERGWGDELLNPI